MAEMKESSVLFSLNQLMTLEQQRIQEEAATARKRLEADTAARMEAERRARELELERRRLEDERRRLDEARMREEAARLEAMRHATIERARVEAEQQAKIEAMRKQQEHEHAMAKLAGDQQKRRLERLVIAGSLAGVLLIGGTLGVYFGKIKPDAEHEQAMQAAALAAQEEQRKGLEAKLEEQRRRMSALEDEYKRAKSEADRLEIKKRMDDIAGADKPQVPGLGGRLVVTKPNPTPTKVCEKGDPLCSDLH